MDLTFENKHKKRDRKKNTCYGPRRTEPNEVPRSSIPMIDVVVVRDVHSGLSPERVVPRRNVTSAERRNERIEASRSWPDLCAPPVFCLDKVPWRKGLVSYMYAADTWRPVTERRQIPLYSNVGTVRRAGGESSTVTISGNEPLIGN